MRKTEIIKNVAKKTGFTLKDVKQVIDCSFDLMQQSLIDGDKLVLDGIGNVHLYSCPGRVALKGVKFGPFHKASFRLSSTLKRKLYEEKKNG